MKRTERGWGGHFIGANECRFRRNTLLEHNGQAIVVSTVGNYEPHVPVEYMKDSIKYPVSIGCDRYYETMVWRADTTKYKDAAINAGEISFNSKWSINKAELSHPFIDNIANDMHEKVVDEMTERLINGEVFKGSDEE